MKALFVIVFLAFSALIFVVGFRAIIAMARVFKFGTRVIHEVRADVEPKSLIWTVTGYPFCNYYFNRNRHMLNPAGLVALDELNIATKRLLRAVGEMFGVLVLYLLLIVLPDFLLTGELFSWQ